MAKFRLRDGEERLVLWQDCTTSRGGWKDLLPSVKLPAYVNLTLTSERVVICAPPKLVRLALRGHANDVYVSTNIIMEISGHELAELPIETVERKKYCEIKIKALFRGTEPIEITIERMGWDEYKSVLNHLRKVKDNANRLENSKRRQSPIQEKKSVETPKIESAEYNQITDSKLQSRQERQAELIELKYLLEQGLINEREYELSKARILGID